MDNMNNHSNFISFEISATFNMTRMDDGSFVAETNSARGFELSAEFENTEDAEAFVALFPKSAQLDIIKAYSKEAEGGFNMCVRHYSVLAANGSNGGVNETAQKRIRSLFKKMDKLDLHPEWVNSNNCINAFATQEEFMAAAF